MAYYTDMLNGQATYPQEHSEGDCEEGTSYNTQLVDGMSDPQFSAYNYTQPYQYVPHTQPFEVRLHQELDNHVVVQHGLFIPGYAFTYATAYDTMVSIQPGFDGYYSLPYVSPMGHEQASYIAQTDNHEVFSVEEYNQQQDSIVITEASITDCAYNDLESVVSPQMGTQCQSFPTSTVTHLDLSANPFEYHHGDHQCHQHHQQTEAPPEDLYDGHTGPDVFYPGPMDLDPAFATPPAISPITQQEQDTTDEADHEVPYDLAFFQPLPIGPYVSYTPAETPTEPSPTQEQHQAPSPTRTTPHKHDYPTFTYDPTTKKLSPPKYTNTHTEDECMGYFLARRDVELYGRYRYVPMQRRFYRAQEHMRESSGRGRSSTQLRLEREMGLQASPLRLVWGVDELRDNDD